MRAGKLDRRITFQTLTDGQDAAGGITEAWANLVTNPTVWAYVHPLTGREFFAAQQVNAEIDTVFEVRYRSDITPKMRIVHDSKNYDIREIKEIGRRNGLEILARAIV